MNYKPNLWYLDQTIQEKVDIFKQLSLERTEMNKFVILHTLKTTMYQVLH